MQIIIEHLYSSVDGQSHWEYSEKVERSVCETMLEPTRTIKSITEGYAPEWDVVLDNGITIELKIQSKEQLFVETSQLNKYKKWVPSGLSLSEADFWLFITPGWGTKLTGSMELVGKARLFKRADLIEAVAKNQNFIQYPSNAGVSINMDRRSNIKHEWLGDIKTIQDDGKILGYNLDYIYKPFYNTQYYKYLHETKKPS